MARPATDETSQCRRTFSNGWEKPCESLSIAIDETLKGTSHLLQGQNVIVAVNKHAIGRDFLNLPVLNNPPGDTVGADGVHD
jgi:hypothetical protein